MAPVSAGAVNLVMMDMANFSNHGVEFGELIVYSSSSAVGHSGHANQPCDLASQNLTRGMTVFVFLPPFWCR